METHHHGPSAGHGASDCGMDMVWNWKSSQVCVVFKWWAITTPLHLILSMVGVFAIALLYEQLLDFVREYDKCLRAEPRVDRDDGLPDTGSAVARGERQPLVGLAQPQHKCLNRRHQAIRALLYGLQVFIAYFLMLVAMTFNGFLVFSVVAGAGVGFFLFRKEIVTGPCVGCH